MHCVQSLQNIIYIRVSEWLLRNSNWAIFQPYHGENKLHFDDEYYVHFVLDQHYEMHS